MDSFELKKVYTSIRPAKVVVIIHKGDNWRNKCLNLIETFSQLWGGSQNFIIPTNGEEIDDKFWFLIENFDPDYFYVYNESRTNPKTSKTISDELIDRIRKLCPFLGEIDENPIQGTIWPHRVNYPLTFLPDIIENTDHESKIIYKPVINYKGSKNVSENLRLLYHSIYGDIRDNYAKKMEDIGFHIEKITKEDINKLSDGKNI